jgi:outer membrane protein TolC
MSKGPRPKVIPPGVLLVLVCVVLTSPAQTPSPSPTPQTPALSLDDALRLANGQTSTFQTALLNERVAAEDVRQARAAFLPKVSTPLSYIYTSPALGLPPGEPRGPSFISSDGIGVYDGLVNVSGDFDIAGRLRATLARNRALLAAAHAGAEVARRELAQAVIEAYYGLALANAQLRAAQQNLAAAEGFEQITSLLFSGGEVAAVDLTRAQLQTLTRRDELQKARGNEAVAAGSLRVFIGYDFSRPVSTTDLALALPIGSEYQEFKADDVSRRPEFTQLEQQLRAATQEIKIARTDRLPSLSYSINGGFDTDSLKGPRL